MSALRVYSRPGCHLCDEAVAAIERAAPGLVFDVIDIESDDALHSRYLERIPVVERGGSVLTELDEFRRVDLAELLGDDGGTSTGAPADRY